MRAIASINADIHQFCLYVLGGASSRRGNGKDCVHLTVFFTSKHSVSGPVSSDFLGLAAPGSAPLHLRRAGLTSVASVEECDECCLYHSDSAILAGFAPRQSAPP